MYKIYLFCVIVMLSLIPSTMSDIANAANSNSKECDMNQTFTAKGRISGLVYTGAESRSRPPHMLLGTWNWTVNKTMTTDFKANIRMVSTFPSNNSSYASDNQTIDILDSHPAPGSFCAKHVQARGTADIRIRSHNHVPVYNSTSIAVEAHGEQHQALKTIKITIENDALPLGHKPIYGIVDYYNSTHHNKYKFS
jgi:hypothetical protein